MSVTILAAIGNAYWTSTWCSVATRYAGNRIAYDVEQHKRPGFQGPGVSGLADMGGTDLVTLRSLPDRQYQRLTERRFSTPNFVNQDGITGGPSITVNLGAYLAAGGGLTPTLCRRAINTHAPLAAP